MAYWNSLNLTATRRLSVALLTVSGALLLTALNLVAAGISAGDRQYAQGVSQSLAFLLISCGAGVVSFLCAELASDRRTPKTGHPHSVANYLQTAFAILVMVGMVFLVLGTLTLVSKAGVWPPRTP